VKVVFLGTSSFACPSLAALAERHEISLVVTQPDRPAGRHAAPRPPRLKEAALRMRLPVIQPEQINAEETVAQLRATSPDVIVVAAYGQLLKPSVFALPPHGAINIHASLLPAYRGAAPVNWAIIQGESSTGISTFTIESGMDTGDILLQRSHPIGPDETAGDLEARLAILGAQVIADTLAALVEGSLAAVSQSEEDASYAPALSSEQGRIDWSGAATRVHNLVRGMNPWPGAWTRLVGERVKIHRTARPGIGSGRVCPGAITVRETNRLLVACEDELIEILEIQREGRQRTSGRDFLNGLRGEEARFD
jgi:methionyl-tRNA formyltransferase